MAAFTYVGPDSTCLVDRTGADVTVAVIDSGIAHGHPHVGPVSGGATIEERDVFTTHYSDSLGHGTAVAAAIREKAPGAHLLSVRVFRDSLRASVDQLVSAIDWSIDHGANLINLSLGTANPDHHKPLATVVARAVEHGALIVSPARSEDAEWLPGSIQGVVPVLLDDDCPREGIRLLVQSGNSVVAASGFPRPIPGVPIERNLRGISFAAANVTGVLAKLIEGRSSGLSLDRVTEWLEQCSQAP